MSKEAIKLLKKPEGGHFCDLSVDKLFLFVSFLFVCDKIWPYVAQDGLKFIVYLRLDLISLAF